MTQNLQWYKPSNTPATHSLLFSLIASHIEVYILGRMTKLALISCLVLALVIVDARVQRFGTLKPGSFLLSSRVISVPTQGSLERVGTVIGFPQGGSHTKRIGCVIITHQSGSETANATIVGGELDTYYIVLAFRSARGGSIDAEMDVWSTP